MTTNQKDQHKKISLWPRLKFWLTRWTLARLMTLGVATVILMAGGGAGFYSFKLLTHHKSRDVLVIQYLELERLARIWKDRMKDIREQNPELSMYSYRADRSAFERVKGSGDDWIYPRELGLTLPSRTEIFLAEHGGRTFVLGKDQTSLIEFHRAKVFTIPSNLADTILYGSSIDQGLIFSTNSKINSINFIERPLVQRFTKSDLGHGFLEFKHDDQKEFYGFFYVIEDTNLVLFAEVPKSLALAGVDRLGANFIAMLMILLLIALLFLQFPLNSISDAMRNLIITASHIAEGNFTAKVKSKGFGEIKTLTEAFAAMGQELYQREKTILNLHEEQKEKIRLEGELAITRHLQENFLPKDGRLDEGPLRIAASYQPASEAAGDWYNFYYDEPSGETVIAIADVSGHGSGSAMFTAIIGGLFVSYREKYKGAFPVDEFLRELNLIFYQMGQRKWHATMLIFRHVKSLQDMEIWGVAHCAPLLVQPNHERKVQSIPLKGMPLGLEPSAYFERTKISWTGQELLIAYTDGLTETRNQRGRVFGVRRLSKIIEPLYDSSPNRAIEMIVNDWNAYKGSGAAEDDLCIIGIRAA